MDFNQFEQILKEKCEVFTNQPIVIGVSGGADSLSLLDLLYKTGLLLVVGHLNHGLRDEAMDEAEIVRLFCQDRSIDCFIETINVREIASTNGQSIEEAGRKARYQFLFNLAQEKKAQVVAVAHNLDDQVETILMHLLRGSGLAGLRGMDHRQFPNEWSKTIPLVRPLLDFSKAEIVEYCRQNGLIPAIDKTNQDRAYYRNRLRMDLVPYLESYNPAIRNRLISMSDVLRKEDDFLQQETQTAIDQSVTDKGVGFYVINRQNLRELHPAILRRVLYRLMKQLRPTTPNIVFETIDDAAKFLDAPTKSGKLSLVAGLEMSIYHKHSIILAEARNTLDDLWPQINRPIDLRFTPAQKIDLNGNWHLELSDSPDIDKQNPWQACLDAAKITSLRLDTFKPGDRFSPLGMQGKSMKLGDYWTNEGLPPRARAGWPLVRSENEIVWVPGFTINDNYKISESTLAQISMMIFKEK
jgi:tRNA(Ile)-lysidine synthase